MIAEKRKLFFSFLFVSFLFFSFLYFSFLFFSFLFFSFLFFSFLFFSFFSFLFSLSAQDMTLFSALKICLLAAVPSGTDHQNQIAGFQNCGCSSAGALDIHL